ncbi:MAG: hypothetical protein JRJ85_08735 [Deltaproteobacteria bacterium]|nr:hypothetical protein [Deltaproteobacteria bacterium]
MTTMIPSYYVTGLFQEMWREIFGCEASVDPDFNKLMAGFESQDLWIVRELWRIGRRAVDMGLESVFKHEDNDTVIKTLQDSKEGVRWLGEYLEFLTDHGWRCERQHAYDTPAWIENPGLGIGRIKMLMSNEVFPADREHDRVVGEREKTEEKVLGKVPEGQGPAFEVLMKAAQKSGYWSEDHTYYCDLYVGAMGRWIATEYGRRFADAGCIDDPEDIHFLHPDEIRKASIAMERINLRPYVERRKGPYEKSLTIDPPPFYGDIEQAQAVLRGDPTLQVSTQLPVVREALKADLYGAGAAPGTVEGVARVIMSADRLNEVKHREYGIPCVAGCLEATQKIKTGQKVKIDGNLGVVYIQDK